jgi:hypothetical protein
MSTIKQLDKRDNVHQKSLSILELSKRNNSRNIIKNVFDVDLHHNPSRVVIEKGSNGKRDSFTTSTSFKTQNLMGG